MKTLVYLSVAFSLIAGSLCAQNFQGVATYKTQRKLDIQLDSTQVTSAMQDQLLAMMKKQFEKEYTLTFNKEASVYEVEESLDTPTLGGGGMQFVVAGGGDADVYYRNILENRMTSKSDLYGKTFLIKDRLPTVAWTLTKETKNIGQYTCFKATRTEMRTVKTSFSSSTDSANALDGKSVEKEVTIIAWYTPEIPLGHGPGKHFGLPGLILEISDGDESILCSKIVLNPSAGVTLDEPTKGKEVTRDQYNAILIEKVAEMKDRYQSSSRDGYTNSIEIRIGG